MIKSRIWSTVQLFCLTILFSLVNIVSAKAVGIPIPEGVFLYKSASNVFGYEAAWINPAGLGRFDGTGAMVMVDYFNNNIAKSWGVLANGEQSAIAYRKLDDPSGTDFKEWIIATGYDLGKLKVGGSYRYFTDGPGIYDNRHFWNIGFQLQGDYRVSAAAVFSNLNRGKIDGERTEVEHRYSISYRPLEFDLTLSADMLRSSSVDLGDALVIYNVSVSPYPGLFVNGLFDSDENFNIAVRANLLQYFVGNESRFKSGGGGRGTTIYAGATDLRQESLVPWYSRRLQIDVPEHMAENPPQPVFGKRAYSFYTLISSIYRAADDASIKELVIKMRQPALGFAQAQELRDALTYFKSSGKTVVCHLSMPNNVGYYVAAVSDSILIPPVSQLNLIGLKAELTFYASTLDKIGVEVDMVKIGSHKTAAETLTRSESSDENKGQVNRLLDNIFEQFVGGIAQGRGISVDSVKRIIDSGPYTSVDAVKYGLVDGLSYADEIKKNFLSPLPEISLKRYVKDTLVNDGWPSKPELAVIVAEGEMAASADGFSPWQEDETATPSELGKALLMAEKNKDVKGIVFRVNSPGGYALAAEDILHSAEKASRKKPIVVSMGNLAASGGYFVSMKSERLFADAGTLTGSIGIFGGKVSLEKLYQKIGLGKELYTRGKFAGMASTIRPFTEDEREKQVEQIGAFYGYFTDLVAQNRKMESDSVEVLAQGKVWTGKEAVENGLIDEVGGLKQALDYAAARLNLEDYRIVFYPEKRPLFVFPGNPAFKAVASILGIKGNIESENAQVSSVLNEGGLFTRMLFDISIE